MSARSLPLERLELQYCKAKKDKKLKAHVRHVPFLLDPFHQIYTRLKVDFLAEFKRQTPRLCAQYFVHPEETVRIQC